MLKAHENPPIIYPEFKTIQQLQGQWWVVHTKSRNEKALAHDFINNDISYFLPMSWKVKRLSRRTLRTLLPLFSGYIFFCGQENQKLNVLRTNRVANIIEVNDQDTLITELSQIEQALRAGAPLVPDKYIRKGTRCRVIAGPLLGLEGIVVEVKGRTRLVLQIDILGQAASVEIDRDMVEPIDKARIANK